MFSETLKHANTDSSSWNSSEGKTFGSELEKSSLHTSHSSSDSTSFTIALSQTSLV